MIQLARPYAKALFKIGTDFEAQLTFLAKVSQDQQMAALMADPMLPRAKLVALFLACGQGILDERGARLVALLAENRRLSILPMIAKSYAKLCAKAKQVLRVKWVTVVPPTALQKAQLIKVLGKKWQQEIQLTCVLETNLLGGGKDLCGGYGYRWIVKG